MNLIDLRALRHSDEIEDGVGLQRLERCLSQLAQAGPVSIVGYDVTAVGVGERFTIVRIALAEYGGAVHVLEGRGEPDRGIAITIGGSVEVAAGWRLAVVNGRVVARRVSLHHHQTVVEYFSLDNLPPDAPAHDLLREVADHVIVAEPITDSQPPADHQA